MGDPQPVLLGLTITSYLLLLFNVAIFGTYSILGLNNELVRNTFGDLKTTTVVLIYSSWTIVYVYQIIWVLYALVLVIRRRPGDPVLISTITLGLYVFTLVLQLVVNTVFLIEVSFPFLLSIFAILLASLAFSYQSLYNNRIIIAKQNLRRTDSLIRGLVQNGIDIYSTWAFITALFEFSVILKTRTSPPLTPSIAQAITLVFVFLRNFFYVLIDLAETDKFSRYTVTPYFLRIWAIAFVLSLPFSVGLLILIVLILLFNLAALIRKFVVIHLWQKIKPLIPSVPDTEVTSAK